MVAFGLLSIGTYRALNSILGLLMQPKDGQGTNWSKCDKNSKHKDINVNSSWNKDNDSFWDFNY